MNFQGFSALRRSFVRVTPRPIFVILPMLLLLGVCLFLSAFLHFPIRPGPPTYPDPVEEEVSTTADVKFAYNRGGADGAKGYYTLEFSREGDEAVSLLVPVEMEEFAASCAKLPAQSYRIDLFRISRWKRLGSKYVAIDSEADLARISNENGVIYDGSICPLHHHAMERKLVDIRYGFPGSGFSQEAEAHFPNGLSAASGGCCVDEARTKTWIWVCPDCAASEKEWEAAQR